MSESPFWVARHEENSRTRLGQSRRPPVDQSGANGKAAIHVGNTCDLGTRLIPHFPQSRTLRSFPFSFLTGTDTAARLLVECTTARVLDAARAVPHRE